MNVNANKEIYMNTVTMKAPINSKTRNKDENILSICDLW